MKTNLTTILKAQTKQLRRYLNKIANRKGRDCWLLEPKEKEGKVCIVAHIDTVWDDDGRGKGKPKNRRSNIKTLIHDKDKGLIWSPNGLGADDRAGVYAALKLFNEIPEPYKPYVLFTDYEESGGIGAYEAAEVFKTELSRCNFLIELDRANGKDAVFYSGEPEDFTDYILEFGFRETIGSFSDISIICPEVRRCGVNLSIGYYNEHTDREYLDINKMNSTIKKVEHILLSNHRVRQIWELEIAAKYGWAQYPKDSKHFGTSLYDYDDNYECPYCYEELRADDLTYNGRDIVYGHCRRCTEHFEIY